MKSFMTIPFLGKWSHLSFSNSWWHPLVVFSEIENIFHLFIHTHYKVVKSLWDHKGTFWQITKYQNELLKRQQWLYNKLLKLAIVWFCVREDICMLKPSLPFFFFFQYLGLFHLMVFISVPLIQILSSVGICAISWILKIKTFFFSL